MRVETYLKYLDSSEAEISKLQRAPNIKLWTDMGLSNQAKHDILQQYIKMEDDYYGKEAFIQLLLIKHNVYNKKPFGDICYVLKVIKEYFDTKQLGEKEHLVSIYDLEYMFKNVSRETRASLICNQITEAMDFDNISMTNCGVATAPNFVEKLFRLRKRLPETNKYFKNIYNHIFYFIEEILHSVITIESTDEECIRFTVDFVIGHERQHIAMGNCSSQYKYINDHWDDKFVIFGEYDIREQICNKAGYLYAMECYNLRMDERQKNFY